MLNYHHLRYFQAVAHEGNLTRAAEKLNLSQSALSTQIKSLEARLGQALFERIGRQLVLTEVGRIALDHADRIFATGAELEATLAQTSTTLPPFRIGALSTLSRNFQRNSCGLCWREADVRWFCALVGLNCSIVCGRWALMLSSQRSRRRGRPQLRSLPTASHPSGLACTVHRTACATRHLQNCWPTSR